MRSSSRSSSGSSCRRPTRAFAFSARAVKSGNQFVHLGRRLNTYIEFRHVREDLRTHAEAFCIADQTALVYRLQASRWEGIADTHEPAVAKLYGTMFDEIWLASEVATEFRQLGI